MVLLAFTVASNNFDLVHFGEVSHLPEFDIVQHQRPHVIAEPVSVKFGCFECDTSLHLGIKCRVYRFIELQQHLECKLRRNLSVLQENKNLNFNPNQEKSDVCDVCCQQDDLYFIRLHLEFRLVPDIERTDATVTKEF